MTQRLRDDYIVFARSQMDDLAQTTFTQLAEGDLPYILDNAVALYSDDQPRRLASVLDSTNDEDDPAGGVQEWMLTTTGGDDDLFPGWTDGFSKVETIEVAFDTDRPVQLRPQDYSIRTAPMSARGGEVGQKLRLFSTGLRSHDADGEKLCVFYTAPHKLDDVESTVRPADEVALGYLFCNHLCIAIAGRLRRTQDKRTGAAGIDFSKSKADEYISQGKVFYEKYRMHLGLPDKGPPPFSMTTSFPTRPGWGGGRYLTHGR